MNILFISNLYPAYPGQARTEMTYALHQFTQEWVHSGENVLSIALWDCYPKIFGYFSDFAKKKKLYAFEEIFQLDSVPILRIPTFKIPHFPYSSRETEKLANQVSHNLESCDFQPDIMVVHGLYPAQIASVLKSRLDTPMVTGIHITDQFRIEKKRFPKSIEQVLKTSDGFAFRSEAIKKAVMKKIPEYINQENSFVALSGIDESIIISDQELAYKISRNSEKTTIMTACQLKRRKNTHLLIKAFSAIENSDLELIIIGDGPERKKLEHLAQNLNVSDRVHFMGQMPRDKVIDNLRKADIFIMVSHSETFGLVYLEAMASGCITVGTKGEGIDGVIKDGENGFLCEPNATELSKILSYPITFDNKRKMEFLKDSIQTTQQYSSTTTAKEYLKFLSDFTLTSRGLETKSNFKIDIDPFGDNNND